MKSHTINTLIAREVMGWEHDCGGWWWTGPNRTPSDLNQPISEHNPAQDREWIPNFTDDIFAAMRVVEKLADLGHVLLIKADGLRDKDHRYNVVGVEGRLSRDCSTPMAAICEAALALAVVSA